ncbi:MAG: GEVED domain-containing protein [Rubripirellula sp.]
MTLRDSSVRNVTRKADRSFGGRLRDKRRRKDRRLLSESLEQRQLLAGPDLIGIQPNEGALLNEGTVLSVSPRELVFRFDDDASLDPNTLSAIRITRAGEGGVFESATAISDLGTDGDILVEFRAAQSGSIGNGIQVEFTSSSRPNTGLPLVSVTDETVFIDVNNNPLRETRVQDLIAAVAANPEASALIEVLQVSGSSLGEIGQSVPDGLRLTLAGANAAEAVTDFGTNGDVRVRFVSQLPGSDGLGTEIQLERRNFGGPANPVIVVNGNTIRIQLNSSSGFETTAQQLIDSVNANPGASALIFAALQEGDASSPIGASLSLPPLLTLSGVTDVSVDPGYVGLGDSAREVVFRFAEPLPDDLYQVDIVGTGSGALRNTNGELFQDGLDFTRQFNINLGPQVVAVVPEPVRRNSSGELRPEVGRVEVHFNDDDLDLTLAQTTGFYQLIFTRDSVRNTDDVVIIPNSVQYNNVTNIATLDFGRPLSRISDPSNPTQFLAGAARLRVGAGEGLPTPPTDVSLVLDPSNPVEPGDSFDTAFDLNSQWAIGTTSTQSARLTSEIFNTTPYGLELPGPDLPGSRDIRPDDPSRLLRTVPLDYLRNGADVVDGISVIQYNFAPSWLGDDPNQTGILEDRTYFNVISEQQKERVREVMQLYSEYLGVSFVEVEGDPTSSAFISVAVGDLYGGDESATSGDGGLAVVTRDRNGDGIDDLGVMDLQDFDESVDDQFGGEFFRGAMFVVGQLLGYGYADDLPQPVTQSSDFIFTPGGDNEPAFPSVADIVHGQYLYRPDSTDIDLYRFSLETRGTLSVETLAERLGDPSLLDSVIRIYRMGNDGSFVEIAQNDDYFSNDSFVQLEVDPGTYMIGVSARGNTDYDPTIEGTGYGGLTEGEYELVIDFRPNSTNGLADTTGVALDGEGDGRPGGVFDFWFEPNDVNNTLYVDKASTVASGTIGTVGNPYREIDQAIAASNPGDTIRILGNGGIDGLVETLEDNFSYQIGFASNGLPLQDGSSLDLPQGVRMIIDSGAILKMSRSRIGVGSVSPLVDGSDASLQLLGTPTIVTANGLPARDASNSIIPGSVFLTSINDDSIGSGNTSSFGPDAKAGDWGGVDFRGDLDTADESRRNRELEGVFLNHVQYADIRFGGGPVSIGGQQVVVSPIDMAVTRPTIINSSITSSADAAIAATPDTFTETRFTDPFYQAAGTFTPDYSRVGPKVSGNTVIDNSINGLFVRVVTRTGDVLETIDTSARFDDTDIPHVLTETLVIEGTAGGPVLQSSAPSSLLVRLQPAFGGSVPAGSYTYRITNVDSSGLESASSQQTVPITLAATGGIRLDQLPTVGAGGSFIARRLYRADVDPGTGLPGEFRLVQQLNASDTTAFDFAAAGTTVLSTAETVLRSRLDASLVVDPGTVIKLDGARIEARMGANLIAEGLPSLPVVFTSLEDQRYGGGGTFDTNDRGGNGSITPGDWGGIYVGPAGSASIDQAVIAGAGGTTRIEGGFASFNPIEVHQGNLRLANSRLEFNADGRGEPSGDRVGRGDNSAATVFARAAAPVILNNEFVGGQSAALSIDINSFASTEVYDQGRSTGEIDSAGIVGNSGPLIQGNVLDDNDINGLLVRGGQLATSGVLDDVDIVHVVTDSIEIPNQHIFGGLRLQSDARGSLVVKFESAENENAGIVVGGSLLSAEDEFRDIADRVGGSLQVVGHPDFSVILTTLADDASGAGFTLDGLAQRDTNNDGIIGEDLVDQAGDGFIQLPFGPEVNRGGTIDNDVDVNVPGYFEATPGDGHAIGVFNPATGTGVTVFDAVTGAVSPNQSYFFDFATYVIVNGVGTRLDATTITQAVNLVGDDLVESQGSFAGPNGDVTWTAQTTFRDGIAVMFSSVELTAASGTQLGDIQVVNFFHPDVGFPGQENLFPSGTPGAPDFRAITYQVNQRFGFGHGGYYVDDGVNQQNATYTGWAADIYALLEADIATDTQTYSIAGDVDQANLPPIVDPRLGNVFGTGDVNTAFAWDVDPTAANSVVTSFIELIDRDPADRESVARAEPGLWDGVVVREAAHDRNVAAFAEQEPVRSAFVDTNSIPSQSQFLGEIAPDLQSGDENRRLGFIVNGSVTTSDDLDVYSFIAESGTEVFLDIDLTGNRLDSVVELIDANGRVLAASNDSLLAETNDAAIFSGAGVNPDAAQPLSVVNEQLPVQQLTISESIVDATGGVLTLSVAGLVDPVLVDVDAFLLDPAAAITAALEAMYPAELGDITGQLLRRHDREVDPNNVNVTTREGDDFVVQLQFDADLFVGRSVPAIGVDGSTVTGVVVATSVAETLLASQVQDDYSTNDKDAGFRIRLPGESGTRNLYHVRVRSSNTRDPLDFATLTDASRVRDGLTVGSYELQIRLQENNEQAGTQIRLTDVRFATNGLQIIGQPLHSPLLGEEHETTADNDSLANAQPLGYFGSAEDQALAEAGPLQSDQLSKAFSGDLDSATDVDWYEFTVNYENITRDAAALYLSTVFDLDYASGFARADMALYVFDAQGQLVLIGGDSNVADDLPGSTNANDTDDLSRGSAGAEDPYIGTAELSEGTYFVAVANQQQVPAPLDQFFNANSANPLLRLEPIDSVTRIAEDRINFSGGGTATSPEVPLLFDADSIVDYTFDDTLLYVNTATSLLLVNPFTGVVYGSVGDLDERINDVAFRANGELFGYTENGPIPSDTSSEYVRIDTGTGALTTISTGAGIQTFHLTDFDPMNLVLDEASDDGIEVEAITIREFLGQEEGFFIGNRPIDQVGLQYSTNILYDFDDETGLATGPNYDRSRFAPGAGTTPREVGQINTEAPPAAFATQLGISDATEVNRFGIAVPSIRDGDTFTLSNVTESVTFEFEQGFTLFADGSQPVRDGDSVIIDGVVFEFNSNSRLQLSDVAPLGLLNEGTTVSVEGTDGIVTFEFVRFAPASPGNIEVSLVDAGGAPLSVNNISASLSTAINANVTDVTAQSLGDEVFFVDSPLSLTTAGSGVTVLGSPGLNNPLAIEVPVSETIGREALIQTLAEAVRGVGIPVSNAGTQMSMPSATSLMVVPDPANSPSAFSIIGTPGVTAGNVAILLLPTDTAGTIAQRISIAVQEASDSGDLPNVTAIPNGHSLNIAGGFVVDASGNLVVGGVPTGGTVTGIELVNNQLFAVSDTGGLFQVSAGELDSNGNREVGRYVATATDLVGINFSGLRAGPVSVDNGALSDILFGVTTSGEIHAFNTRGELQPVFAGGRSVISTGVFGALGLDFSVVDFNLWHTTSDRGDGTGIQRGNDPGHGIDPLFNGTRGSAAGGSSLAFTYENNAFGRIYPSLVERPTFAPRTDGTGFEDTFNVPGGAKGVIQSNDFSLDGYSSDDLPTLYFNYFAENDGGNDRLRVYVVTEQGVEHLVASNTDSRNPFFADDEFDDPSQFGTYDDDIDVDVQQLYDNTGTWRQARVALGDFAGQSNLSLRIEYSTGGTTQSSSESIRVTNGQSLAATADREFEIRGSSISVGSETFVIDLAPTVSFPSGRELADLYVDPTETAVITIDGQQYLLNDGTRVVSPGQIEIDLLEGFPAGTTLDDLSANDIATKVVSDIQANLPQNATVEDFNFSDPSDDPLVAMGRNDLLFEATPLPYSGGNLTINGVGRLGTDNGPFSPPTNLDDVDLVRLEVTAGSLIQVDVDLDFNSALSAAIRFFDAEGNEVPGVPNPAADTIQFTSSEDGVVYIGISGLGNENYDPRIPGSADAGQIDTYTASVTVTLANAYRTDGNLIEFAGGQQSITVSQPDLFTVTDSLAGSDSFPVPISRFMTSDEVATQVQRAIANRFFAGNTDALPVSGANVRLPALAISDAGPFVSEDDRYGDQYASGVISGTRNNTAEGIYLDDFIIGFAERGEIATSSNVVNSPFVLDTRPQFPVPADPTSNLATGSYQVEIRDASEYVSSISSSQFRTFDTNDRLTSSIGIEALPASEIGDGDVFTIFDGRSTVEFEFDQVELGNGVQPGRVQVPFALEMIDPESGLVRAQTAAEVANSIVAAINRADVQSVIDAPALSSAGVDGATSTRINLFGDVIVNNDSGVLASVERTNERGDDNRDRVSQGVILVENSRFLFNEDYGVVISHGLTAEVDDTVTPSVTRYPRNLVELNTESFATGVVIQSNVIAFNEAGGLQIDGIPQNADETASDPVWYDRILNNTIIGGQISPGRQAPAETFNGVLFPQGAISFADAVVEYLPDAGGVPPQTAFQVADNALGAPDGDGIGAEPVLGDTTVSLGFGGSITLQFTDNLLTGSGDSRPDLIVFETGEVESVRVEISRDGVSFQDVGIVGGLSNSLDIDAAGFGLQDRFAFVRLTDLRQGDPNSTTAGADIDSVGALSSVPVETYAPGGIGIELTGNAAPVLLNNIISNAETGIEIDPTYSLPLLGGNSYYRNTLNVTDGASVGQFPQELSDAEVIFVGASELVFAPAASASIIDASIDSLEDRASITSVKNPLGLPPSPILAPDFDVNGQLRVDDPNVETPNGLGERVFKDRGAFDRGDLVGPRVVLLSPKAPNLGLDSGMVTVLGQPPQFFEVQLIDGIAPADVVPGTGIDDSSISSQSVLLLKDNVALIEGVDYRFSYHPSTNVIRLTPIAGVWETNSTYVIRMIDSSDAIVQATDGASYVDGGVLNVIDGEGETTSFEYETGITVSISDLLIELGIADGVTLEIFDGFSTVIFELDDDQSFDPLNVQVQVPATLDELSIAIADAINASQLNLNADPAGGSIQLLGSNPLSTITSSSGLVTSQGAIGTAIGFGLQIPNDGSAVSDTVEDGQTFIVRQGSANSATFELDTNGSVTAGNIPVSFVAGSSLDQIANAIVRAVGGAPLGLSPQNAGFGRVSFGGDANYSLDVSDSTLTQLGFPGDAPNIPIVIDIDFTDEESAAAISAAIDAANLPGTLTSIVDSRVFLEGTGGVSGVGAVDTIAVRDEVGNLLQSNQSNGRTELSIFIGGGFDYGDAPGPYLSTEAQGGPRHAVDETFALSPVASDRPLTADNDAKLDDADDDNGVRQVGIVQPGFAANFAVDIKNDDGRQFFFDAWFDWNGNGSFEVDEVRRFGSAGTGLPVLSVGGNVFTVNVPSNATTGEIYARFRLSEHQNLGSTGEATSGEVEDHAIIVDNNPFQNPINQYDVNDSGTVTPLDALQIINVIDRNGGSIFLDVLPLPTDLPPFPDVSGDSIVSALDALRVINELGRVQANGEGEATSYVQMSGGVLASGATALGDALIAEASEREGQELETVASVEAPAEKTSVFDNAAVVEIDSIVDSLAEDTATAREDSETDALDQLFASL